MGLSGFIEVINEEVVVTLFVEVIDVEDEGVDVVVTVVCAPKTKK